ncbi:MAG: hypothetical protein MUE97_02160 [Phycisphaerales bacterium]|jgi:hypothetical protein|nr:hypothetical protein [Phycisphaerales bacterium]
MPSLFGPRSQFLNENPPHAPENATFAATRPRNEEPFAMFLGKKVIFLAKRTTFLAKNMVLLGKRTVFLGKTMTFLAKCAAFLGKKIHNLGKRTVSLAKKTAAVAPLGLPEHSNTHPLKPRPRPRVCGAMLPVRLDSIGFG